jgi:two-component system, NtrC family, response regulator AtoC
MPKKYITRIFVVEDDPLFSRVLKHKLEAEENFEVTMFTTGEEFLKNLYLNPDIVTLDYTLPGITGIELLKRVVSYSKGITPIILSAQEDVKVVVQAYKSGAKDYIIKNDNAIVELMNSIQNFTTQVNLRKQVEELKSQIIDRDKYLSYIGESKPALAVLKLVQRIEKTNMMVMITGESGTGKEVVSKMIHINSLRKREPFVPVNMAAIPQDLIESELFGHEKGAFTGADSKRIGKFEEANRGTIFLDEIGEMDMNLQTNLLRVLQESTISRVGSNKEIKLDVRVIAATNKDLGQLVKANKFREDLFFRLQGFLIHLPPLRDRGNDVLLLAKHFLKEFCKINRLSDKSFSKDAIEKMLDYRWPGNIRELKNTIERTAIITDAPVITAEDFIFSRIAD